MEAPQNAEFMSVQGMLPHASIETSFSRLVPGFRWKWPRAPSMLTVWSPASAYLWDRVPAESKVWTVPSPQSMV